MEGRAPKAQAQAVTNVLTLFARTCRARQIYADNNAVLIRMRRDLEGAFTMLLKTLPELSLKVRADAFYYDEEPVLAEPNPDESIPFAFYRDGVRRLDFHRGISADELDVLVAATAQGFSFSGLGDDIVANLWRHDLEHVRYVVVDTSIVDAAAAVGPSDGSVDVGDVDNQIDGLLRSIYGDSSEDVGPRSVHVDATDLPAKTIAESLDVVDEMAPGFHPPRNFLAPPVYREELVREIESFSDQTLRMRMMFCCLWVLQHTHGGPNAEATAEALLRAYDAALLEEDLPSATYAIRGMTHLAEESHRAAEWLDQAIDDARLRQATGVVVRATHTQGAQDAFAFFRACGKRAVESLITQLEGLSDPSVRRAYADLILEIGVEDVSMIRSLLTNEQAFVAQEAVYLLSRIRKPEAIRLLAQAASHEHPNVRLAMMDHITRLPEQLCQVTCIQLLEDSDPRLRVAAAATLGTIKNEMTAGIMKDKILAPEFVDESYVIKETYLSSYAKLNEVWALRLLTKYVKKGTAMLANAAAEEMAMAAAKALKEVPKQRAIDALRQAAKSRKKRLKAVAQSVLEELGQA